MGLVTQLKKIKKWWHGGNDIHQTCNPFKDQPLLWRLFGDFPDLPGFTIAERFLAKKAYRYRKQMGSEALSAIQYNRLFELYQDAYLNVQLVLKWALGAVATGSAMGLGAISHGATGWLLNNFPVLNSLQLAGIELGTIAMFAGGFTVGGFIGYGIGRIAEWAIKLPLRKRMFEIMEPAVKLFEPLGKEYVKVDGRYVLRSTIGHLIETEVDEVIGRLGVPVPQVLTLRVHDNGHGCIQDGHFHGLNGNQHLVVHFPQGNASDMHTRKKLKLPSRPVELNDGQQEGDSMYDGGPTEGCRSDGSIASGTNLEGQQVRIDGPFITPEVIVKQR